MSPSISRESKSPKAELGVPDSRQQPPWHVVVLGIFASPPLYVAYWTYKTIRDLKRESFEVNGPPDDARAMAAGVERARPAPLPPRNESVRLDEHLRDTLYSFSRMSPFLRGIGVLVPILNIYLLCTLVIGICNLVPNEEAYPRQKPLIATGCVLAAFLGILALGRLPGESFMFSLVALIPIAVAQDWLNKYWAHVESPEVFVRYGFSVVEMIVIIVGAAVLGLVVAGLMMGVRY